MLISFEGIDGSGKSTQVRRLKEYLEGKGKKVEVSHEPTGGYWGRKFLRSITTGPRMTKKEEVECLLRDRKQHYATFLPLLEAGVYVLLDRYFLSMVAYQGANGGEVENLLRWNRDIVPDPDLCLYLDILPEKAVERIKGRGEGETKLETLSFLTRVREIYARFTFPWLHRIDADGNADEVATRVVLEFERH